MRIEGKAKIQLFDAKTGELQYEVEEKNVVTDLYKHLINNPSFVNDLGFGNTYRVNLHKMTPMATKIFGGCILLAEPKDGGADAKNIRLTKKDFANFVGSAGQAWSGKSEYRGSFNELESGWNEENKEYKLVWDFPSNAANSSKISCICLCPSYLGDNGLLRDVEDTSTTNITIPYGMDLFHFDKIYMNSYGVHHFHAQKTNELGYYLYSKDSNTNVYARSSGKKYYFTEVKKKDTLGLYEACTDVYASNSDATIDNLNLYEIGETIEVDYEEETSIQSSRFLSYYAGYIWGVVVKENNAGNITFRIIKINASNYSKATTEERTMTNSDLMNTTLYPKCIFGNIYFTTKSNATSKYLYILDGTAMFKSLYVGQTNGYLEPIQFFDTIAVIRKDTTESKQLISILDANDRLCDHYLYFSSSNSSYPCFEKIYMDDNVLAAPFGVAPSMYNHSSSGELQYLNTMLSPCCSTTNIITNPISKNSSNVLKITYYLHLY